MTELTDEAIGVVVTRGVPVANLEAFEAVLRELMQIASKQPGQVAGDGVRGAVRGGEREYFIVYRFADEARLRAWEASPERRALVGRIDALPIGGRRPRVYRRSPPCVGAPDSPPRPPRRGERVCLPL